jgi:hypothetical protein
MRGVTCEGRSWWGHAGPLAVVFTGLPDGTVVLPVRLPTEPGNQPILDHHLADPDRWHKIDLVRRQDPNVVGGWRYEAHLLVLTQPYVAPAVVARRAAAAIETVDRAAGIDVNVSNVTVASHEDGGGLRVTRVDRDAGERDRSVTRSRRERRRQRQLDRSQRAANPDQYQLSERQTADARRRDAAGRPPRLAIRRGPRVARADGKPVRSYRRDRLSKKYRRGRAAQAAAAASVAQARRDHARQVAGQLVREHGVRFTVEDCDLRAWSRRWGRALAAFSPAILLAAIAREAAAVAAVAGGAGGIGRASTQTTALSQHCLCGHRVEKSLDQRVHACPHCGLAGDRDAVAATLCSFVTFAQPGVPASATVDYGAARASLAAEPTRIILRNTLRFGFLGRQDVPSESNAHSARDGSFVTGWGGHPTWSWWLGESLARRHSQPRMSLTPTGQTTSDRPRMRTNLPRDRGTYLLQLRDSS